MSTRVSSWRTERPGLTVVCASLGVIALIIALLLDYQRDAKVTQIRAQGISITRVLSGMSLAQLVPEDGRLGPLSVLQHRKADSDFAYAVLASADGSPMSDVAAPGVVIPVIPSGKEPSSWLVDRVVTLGADGRKATEFRAPILEQGEFVAEVRIAFFEPSLLPGYGELPFLATLALPIFLLVPLFYWLLKREVRPLMAVSRQLEEAVESEQFRTVDVQASGALAEFMERFNQFSGAAEGRIRQLETGRDDLVTSAKLISYKKSRIETVLQTLPNGVLIFDENGQVSYANEKLPTLLGISKEDIFNRPPREWQTYPEVIDLLTGHEHGIRRPMDTVVLPVNHSRRTLALNSYPLFSPRDSSITLGTLVVVRDATEEALAKQSRAEFVAHVAHELKTPLNTLTLYSEMLMDNGDDQELRVEAINVIQDEVERVGSLISNLLNITRIEMGSLDLQKNRIRMREFLKDAFEHISHNARGKDLNFELDLPRDLPPIQVDKDLLRVAINNLLTNAIKYNDDGGTVRLAAEETADAVIIRVEDTGVGITQEDCGRVFDRFYRGQSAQVAQAGGHGLGLALAKDIVELHEGSLSVESELGKGSTFAITLRKEAGLLKQAI
jgi:signal transduction histidine kinase